MVDVAHVGVGHTLVFHAVARQEFTEVSLVVPWGMFDFVGGSAQLSVALVQFQVFFVSSCIRCGAPHCAIPTCIIDGLGPQFFCIVPPHCAGARFFAAWPLGTAICHTRREQCADGCVDWQCLFALIRVG